MKAKKKIWKWPNLLLLTGLVLLVLQLWAKYYLGLGDLPVYITNKDYEYIYAPNQDVYRFHHHISTNAQSMRSKPLSKNDLIRILKFGDSVINGGVHVDQDKLSSSVLENNLSKEFDTTIRVLNISAQSWGPDNAFAYLKTHGDFGSHFFVLVFSSHDLHDNMHFKPVVGVHKAWPASKPWCALTDGFNRYFVPWIKRKFGAKDEEYDYLYDFDDSKINPGWKSFFDYADNTHAQLLVYLHATTEEIEEGRYDRYGIRLAEMLEENHIPYIKGIEWIKDKSCYRDKIHLNEKGHAALARILQPYLEEYVRMEMNGQKTAAFEH